MKVWKIDSSLRYYNNVLDCNKDSLEKYLRGKSKDEYYGKPILINKKNGQRTIYAINRLHNLYDIQKNIINNFLNNIMLPDVSYGFKKESNFIDYLIPHVDFYGNNNYLRIDIKNFFDSITTQEIKNSLEYYFDEEDLPQKERKDLIDKTISICTYNNKLIQGAPSSPIVSNIVFRKYDIRIEKYCRCFDVVYTRYADDMLFSAPNNIIFKDSFLKGISKILYSGGFKINYSKMIKSKNYISLGGYVISSDVRLSRKKISNINKILFYIENNINYKDSNYYKDLSTYLKRFPESSHIEFNGIYSLINNLAGNRAFIISVAKYSNDIKFIKKADQLIKRLESMIEKLDSCINKSV